MNKDIFTKEEWYNISLCVGLTVGMADETEEGIKRLETGMKAMEAMRRVHGEGFHSTITRELEESTK